MEFVKEYGWIIIAVVGILTYACVLYKKYGIVKVRELAYALMLAAEKQWPEMIGEDKLAWVADMIYPLMPKSMRMVFNKMAITVFLQECYDDMKDFLDDGEVNNSN